MENCLVTKLKGVVDNPNLEKINESIMLNVLGSNEENSCLITVKPKEGKTITVKTSDGRAALSVDGEERVSSYTISTLQSVIIYNGSTNFNVILVDKYNLDTFFVSIEGSLYNIFLLNEKFIRDCQKYFDITKFHSKIDYLAPFSINVEDINTSLIVNALQGIKVVGDISNLYFPNITQTPADWFEDFMYITGGNATGTIDTLIQNTPAVMFIMDGSKLSGDLSKAHPGTKRIDFFPYDDNISAPSLTWKTVRPASSFILSINGGNLGEDVDAMLKNQAQCVSKPYTQWDNTISVSGTHHTDDPDAVAAINTLKGLGWVISINGVTM